MKNCLLAASLKKSAKGSCFRIGDKFFASMLPTQTLSSYGHLSGVRVTLPVDASAAVEASNVGSR